MKKKIICIMICMLMIVTSLATVTASYAHTKVENSTTFNENLLGTIQILHCHSGSLWKIPNIVMNYTEAKVFNFHRENNKVYANFSVLCETWCQQEPMIARFSHFRVTIYSENSTTSSIIGYVPIWTVTTNVQKRQFLLLFSDISIDMPSNEKTIRIQLAGQGFPPFICLLESIFAKKMDFYVTIHAI